MQRLDAVIIGTGPAGLEAAVNLKIREKSFILFGTRELSRKLTAAPKIYNYLGFPGISGVELAQKYKEHLEYMGIEITEKHVSMVYHMGGYCAVATASETFEATTVILATGTFSAKLFKGEQEFLGRGVGYCATCDAPLYKNMPVAIIGYGDESVHEADFVSQLASEVYYIPAGQASIKPCDKVQIIDDTVVEIAGDKKVTGLKLKNREIAVNAVFVLRETIAPASLVPGLLIEDGLIKVDSGMQTNLAGLYAAGDCTGNPHQYMRAAGQGQVAALSAVSYIQRLTK